MSLKDSYLEIAKRKLDASEACLNKGVQESAGFLTYHSFESAGGALCEANGKKYPRRHKGKLNQFVVIAKKLKKGHAVGHLTIQLIALREKFLYPEPLPNGYIREPKDVITLDDSMKLKKRVKGIVDWVEKMI